MVLLAGVSDDVVNFVKAEFDEVIYQNGCFGRVNGVQKGGFFAALMCSKVFLSEALEYTLTTNWAAG